MGFEKNDLQNYAQGVMARKELFDAAQSLGFDKSRDEDNVLAGITFPDEAAPVPDEANPEVRTVESDADKVVFSVNGGSKLGDIAVRKNDNDGTYITTHEEKKMIGDGNKTVVDGQKALSVISNIYSIAEASSSISDANSLLAKDIIKNLGIRCNNPHKSAEMVKKHAQFAENHELLAGMLTSGVVGRMCARFVSGLMDESVHQTVMELSYGVENAEQLATLREVQAEAGRENTGQGVEMTRTGPHGSIFSQPAHENGSSDQLYAEHQQRQQQDSLADAREQRKAQRAEDLAARHDAREVRMVELRDKSKAGKDGDSTRGGPEAAR